MKLDGFDTRSGKTRDGDYVDYFPEGERPTRVLRCRRSENGTLIELLHDGEVAEIEQGERVSSPVGNLEIERRLLNAMAGLHFSAFWLEDAVASVDIELIKRGYIIGTMGDDHIWFRKEFGATFIVKRDASPDLLSSFKDPAALIVIGPNGKRLDVTAADFRTLVAFFERDMHYSMYNPECDIQLKGIRFSSDAVKVDSIIHRLADTVH